MKNSRKTAVLLAALLSVSLCACGPVEEAADSVSETKILLLRNGVRYARQCGGKFADG
ncbi:MAG: hypothetical protein ACLTCP_05465 [Ruminococcus bicirculans (ex Wegman et al. 2014)]